MTWNGADGRSWRTGSAGSPRLVELGDVGTGRPDAERVWLPPVSERGEPDADGQRTGSMWSRPAASHSSAR